MNSGVLKPEPPVSVGIMLSYQCTCECKHCMYACTPKAKYWMSKDQLKRVLENLAPYIAPASPAGKLGISEGLHLTGGEPFLNYHLTLESVKIAEELGYPSVFVETNCFWVTSYTHARSRFEELKKAGLEGVLISVNPFTAEFVPYERTKLAIRAALDVWGGSGVLVYHPVYLELLDSIGFTGRINFEESVSKVLKTIPLLFNLVFNPSILLPMGRLVYTLSQFYEKRPAKAYFNVSCLGELTRPWHVHVDPYYNYVPGYCAGITLGDARKLNHVLEGVDLGDRPVLAMLSRDLGSLYRLAVDGYGYNEPRGGYVSHCHLCLDIRLHLALNIGGFKELQPSSFYESLNELWQHTHS
ncbi:MAG: radical SAM protein [Thermofilaceae archaeon]